MPDSLPFAVVTRWLSDAAYSDKDGKPKSLARRGYFPDSFETVVRSISTDVHPRTVLDELSQLGLVKIDDDSVHPKLDAFVPKSDFTEMLAYLGANLHDHAATAVRNMQGTRPAFLEQSIYSDAIYAEAVEELAGLARQGPSGRNAQQPETGSPPPQYAPLQAGHVFLRKERAPNAHDLQSNPARKPK